MWWCRFRREVPEFSGRLIPEGFRRVLGCVGVGSGGFRRVPARIGVGSGGRFQRVPARVGVGSGGRVPKV